MFSFQLNSFTIFLFSLFQKYFVYKKCWNYKWGKMKHKINAKVTPRGNSCWYVNAFPWGIIIRCQQHFLPLFRFVQNLTYSIVFCPKNLSQSPTVCIFVCLFSFYLFCFNNTFVHDSFQDLWTCLRLDSRSGEFLGGKTVKSAILMGVVPLPSWEGAPSALCLFVAARLVLTVLKINFIFKMVSTYRKIVKLV